MRGERSKVLCFAVVAVVLVGFAPAAGAEEYTVKMKGGGTFETRYQPQLAPWDPTVVMFLTGYGNTIAIARSEIASIESLSESKGFGHMLNSTTLALGWAPNDTLDLETEEGKAALAEDAAAGAQQRPVYDQQQFVEPGETTGLPVYGTALDPNYTPPMGGGGEVETSDAPPGGGDG